VHPWASRYGRSGPTPTTPPGGGYGWWCCPTGGYPRPTSSGPGPAVGSGTFSPSWTGYRPGRAWSASPIWPRRRSSLRGCSPRTGAGVSAPPCWGCWPGRRARWASPWQEPAWTTAGRSFRRALRLPGGGPAGRTVRAIGDEQPPAVPPGVTVLPVSARPELWGLVYETGDAQAFQDVATISGLEVSREQWDRDWISDPDAMFRRAGRRRGDRLRRSAARPGSAAPGRACADRGTPGLAQTWSGLGAETHHAVLGGRARLHRGVHLDPAGQRRHAYAAHTPQASRSPRCVHSQGIRS
jgi:hypothetical protein